MRSYGIPQDVQDQVTRIFFPVAYPKFEARRKADGRFAYYTSAETAVQVLKNQELWMRNTATMNDFQEIEHGIRLLNQAMGSNLGKRFRSILDSCAPKVAGNVDALFQAYLPEIKANTFITCLSEHDETEDLHGRLSMWRAYGGRNGVALIFKGNAIWSESELGPTSSPVEYLDESGFELTMEEVINKIEQNRSLIEELPVQYVVDVLLAMFHGAVLCVKHPGFAEEREWRISLSPYFNRNHKVPCDVAVVRGTPQEVMKIPLRNIPEIGWEGVDLSTMLERIIIGPCDFPTITKQALCRILKDKLDIEDAERMVTISGIPLRHF